MIPFRYRKIGQRLFAELEEQVLGQRESVVLIAARYGGKRYLMSRLVKMLEATGEYCVLQHFPNHQTTITNANSFREWLNQAVHTADGRFTPAAVPAEDCFAALDWLIAHSEQPVVLLVSNVDSFSQLFARQLLMKLRTLVEARQLTVALSGEEVFQKLVYGPNSEFNCANQYFLQGFDADLFAEETRRYGTALQLRFDEGEAVPNFLFEQCGGHLSIMKALIHGAIQKRLEQGRPLFAPLNVSEIPKDIEPDLLRQPPRVINNAPECWDDLKQLLRSDISRISTNPLEPSPLELAGVAVREGWNIRLASPLLKRFLRGYYTNKRFGDLYARRNDFRSAFFFYEQMSEDERVRPLNADDRREVSFTIEALSAELHFAATQSPDEVGMLFFRACRYVLGYREVGCLLLSDQWELWPRPGCHLNEETVNELKEWLPPAEPKSGVFELNGKLRHYALAAITPTERFDQYLAVVVCDQSADRPISADRQRLTEQLLAHFVEAYKQATQIVAAEKQLEEREKHIRIATSIFNGLGSSTHNVNHVLELAGDELRKLGYSRVSFCLIEPTGQNIKGTLDVSDNPLVNVAALTDWPLGNPRADIQPYVISTRQSKIVPDAAREPLVNPKVRAAARLKAFAVVPLLTPSNEAIGTIHVERKDGLIPTQTEVLDLEHFGRQLAVAIQQSERVRLQQATLNQFYSIVLIVDSNRRLRYANQHAAEHFLVKPDWHESSTAESLTSDAIGLEAWELICESLAGQRRERHINLPRDESGQHYWEALSDAIRDESNQIIGAFIRIRDMAYDHRMFSAFSLIADATDTPSVFKQLLGAGLQLGFQWGRLYLVDPQEPECLVSHSYFTKSPAPWEDNFKAGLRMSRRSRPSRESWLCLDNKKPMVFYFAKHLADGSSYVTRRGQETTVVAEPRLQDPLHKQPGDFWVDLPLLTQDGLPIGKFTFEWSEKRWPREFDLLEVLASVVSHALEAFKQRDLEHERLQAVRQQTAQKIMATMAHNIGTQLSALPVLLTRYRLREKELPGLAELNQRFGLINEETSRIINRAKERLAGVSPKPAPCNLKECLEQTLKSYLQEPAEWRIDCATESFVIEADSYLLKLALNELLQNSKDAACEAARLELCIQLEFTQTATGATARITYHDNGPGVPEPFKERIFEDFFTHHPGGKPGTGLGMGFVRRVAEAHGGTIIEQGKPGQGAEFVITLPTQQSPVTPSNPSP